VGEHEVRAQLAGAELQGQLPVVFHAVAVAEGVAETLPRVVKIGWQNDGLLPRRRFNEGLSVTFSERMHPQTLTPDTFVVTIELPFEHVYDRAGAVLRYRAYHEVIVPGTVIGSHDGRIWTFQPLDVEENVVDGWIEQVAEFFPTAPTGRIQGTVTAPTGAVAGARVVLVGTTSAALTDAQGRFVLDRVPVQTYTLRAAFIGFEPADIPDVPVLGGLTTTIDVRLGGPNPGAPIVPRDQDLARLRCRVTLKANAILAAEPPRPLDGDAFGRVRADGLTTDLQLPSGDGRRGGDFDSWFWLVRDPRIDPGRRSIGEIEGIGPALTRRLEGEGITTLAELASAAPERVAQILGVSEARATSMIERARELLTQ
jgi:hypothetical protein